MFNQSTGSISGHLRACDQVSLNLVLVLVYTLLYDVYRNQPISLKIDHVYEWRLPTGVITIYHIWYFLLQLRIFTTEKSPVKITRKNSFIIACWLECYYNDQHNKDWPVLNRPGMLIVLKLQRSYLRFQHEMTRGYCVEFESRNDVITNATSWPFIITKLATVYSWVYKAFTTHRTSCLALII